MPRPHKCPVCEGAGMAWGQIAGSVAQVTCHACKGTGVLWEPDPPQRDPERKSEGWKTLTVDDTVKTVPIRKVNHYGPHCDGCVDRPITIGTVPYVVPPPRCICGNSPGRYEDCPVCGPTPDTAGGNP